jgi:hypothetical protein
MTDAKKLFCDVFTMGVVGFCAKSETGRAFGRFNKKMQEKEFNSK